MRFLVPVILIGSAMLIYFSVITPLNEDIKKERARVAELDDALDNIDKIIALRDKHLVTLRAVSPLDTEKIDALLPEEDKRLRLILEIEDLAEAHNLELESVQAGDDSRSGRSGRRGIGPSSGGEEASEKQTFSMAFDVTGSYESFRTFLLDLESNLRLVDVQSVKFTSDDRTSFRNEYTFNVDMAAYWFK